MTVKNDKKQIMIYALGGDVEKFKELQKDFKNKGYNSAALFHEMLNCYIKKTEEF